MTEANDRVVFDLEPDFPDKPVHIAFVDVSDTPLPPDIQREMFREGFLSESSLERLNQLADGTWEPEALCGMKTTEAEQRELESAFDLASNFGINAICDQCLLSVLGMVVEMRRENREGNN